MVKIAPTWVEQNLKHKKGDTFVFALEWPAGIDLSEYEFYFSIQDEPSVPPLLLTEGDGITVNGQVVTVEVGYEDTEDWDWSCANFNYWYIKGGQKVTFIIGKIEQ